MGRKTYVGNAAETTLAGSVTATATSLTLTDGSTYGAPSASEPMVIVVGAGTTAEEQMLISARSGNVLTVATNGRNWHAGGSGTGVSHAIGEVVRHVLDADSIDEANAHVNDTARDDHTQYHNAARFATAFDAAHTSAAHTTVARVQHPHTWAVAADVRVPSGDVDYIPGFFVPVPAGQTVTLVRARHRINSGTSATVKLQRNGVDITGWTAIAVTTANTTTDAADVALADGDYLQLIVTAISGSPNNLSFTAYLRYEPA